MDIIFGQKNYKNMKHLEEFKLNEEYLTPMELSDMGMKLQKLNIDERAKLIWMWIKQDHINLKEFKELLPYITE